MDEAELGFNAWVLIPNLLMTTLGAGEDFTAAHHATLVRLSETLEPVAPPQMLNALAQLSPEDRSLLRNAYAQCIQRLGSEAETTLGLPPEAATGVMTYLENPNSTL